MKKAVLFVSTISAIAIMACSKHFPKEILSEKTPWRRTINAQKRSHYHCLINKSDTSSRNKTFVSVRVQIGIEKKTAAAAKDALETTFFIR